MGRTPAGQTRDRIFRFVRERLLAGLPPTVRDVQQAFDFRAVQTAREHLESLVTEGRLIKKQPGQARGYRLPPTPGNLPTVLIPLLGRVPAGPFDTAIEDLEDYVPVQSHYGSEELFGLRVRGESMRDAGILDGDVVIVRRQPTADSGSVVVALVGDEATVKTLRRRGRCIELHPENPAYEVLTPDPEALTLLGQVIEVRRTLGHR